MITLELDTEKDLYILEDLQDFRQLYNFCMKPYKIKESGKMEELRKNKKDIN